MVQPHVEGNLRIANNYVKYTLKNISNNMKIHMHKAFFVTAKILETA